MRITTAPLLSLLLASSATAFSPSSSTTTLRKLSTTSSSSLQMSESSFDETRGGTHSLADQPARFAAAQAA
eukprot:CAMPEP_0113415382 /NCGR_PEP_ID=MMETSP0013_2-20120614/24535_1 /TAXON_ID=2843 ORGANISM="Skeletonema costatum, Strain 1716" /NCGR_SAMPLE_ID=MMETSP0013_2 /ASSEMBLY_ACC=CAM_ASM_000158 /LENGTH=70 /DNA_ID=CAMNT_0000302331 /DNA_START=321 /DNA_END=529 /DNA_ORIENTATION=+ /assembly_acc=CAM_ASM_000158